MSVDRRYFLKGLMGMGVIPVTPISIQPLEETLEQRIQRLFSSCGDGLTCLDMEPYLKKQKLSLKGRAAEINHLSDQDFIEMLEYNIRQDFVQGDIVDIAGWQLSTTEIAVIDLIAKKA